MRFDGQDDEMALQADARAKPEFDASRWVDRAELPALGVLHAHRLRAVAECFAQLSHGAQGLRLAARFPSRVSPA
jgi:hypothetical protein